MSKTKTNMIIKRIVDAAMTVLLLCLMAYQVTGEMAHEWIGMSMTILVIIHQILNRKWYRALFKGKYNPYRSITTILNILLLLSFALTAFCGMSMSNYAVPFLYGMAPVFIIRRMHLSMSHWAFVLMGLHLGMHIPAMTAGLKLKDGTKAIMTCIFTCVGGIGLWLFLKNGMPNYLFFRVPFAFLDYEKAGWLVFLGNLLMLSFWAFIGTWAALAWWASIPMPIASFLEEYDFSGKTIIPFCSHGGGKFGQSLTAIAKLAPDAVMGEGLPIHYSGGSTLSEEVAAWLEINGIK